mgnify:CR=1 FL=1
MPCPAVNNGIQFTEQPRNRNTAYSRQMRFKMICEANRIEHRLTRPNHPLTNGQVEWTIKNAAVKRFYYDNPFTSRRFHGRRLLRLQVENPRRSDALRIHLQSLDFRARKILRRLAPPDAGNEHLVFSEALRLRLLANFAREACCGSVDCVPHHQ